MESNLGTSFYHPAMSLKALILDGRIFTVNSPSAAFLCHDTGSPDSEKSAGSVRALGSAGAGVLALFEEGALAVPGGPGAGLAAVREGARLPLPAVSVIPGPGADLLAGLVLALGALGAGVVPGLPGALPTAGLVKGGAA